MDEAKVARTHALDQVQASLRDRAQLAGYYYQSLRSSGIPRVLSASLVKQWHWWLHAPECCDE